MGVSYLRGAAMATCAILTLAFAGCGLIQLRSPSLSSLAGHRDFDWLVIESAHFVHYVERNSEAEARATSVVERSEAGIERIAVILGLERYDGPPIHQFVVGSREGMRRLIGRETNGTAFPASSVVTVIASASINSTGAHEPFHVVASREWGSAATWINEGLAVHADGRWHGMEPDAVAHILDRDGALIPLPDLIRRFRSHPDLVSYPQAGSFAGFLREEFGRGAVHRIWTEGDGAIAAATGVSIDVLEARWLARVRATAIEGLCYRAWRAC